MKSVARLFTLVALAGSLACATASDTSFAPGRLVVNTGYGEPTCTTATAVGSACIQGALETNGTLDVAGASTMTGAVGMGSSLTVTGVVTLASTLDTSTTTADFTKEPGSAFNAKTTGAIMTEADTQEDFFYVGKLRRYFELFQDGNNTDNVGMWATGATGWVIPGPNAADQGTQVTEGIVLGSAKSFIAGTTAAFKIRVAFLVSTRAELNNLMVGFRKLGAYAVADDSTEIATAYDDKVIVGIDGNAGVIKQMTSLATVDATTSCTHAAAANGDILALEVNVSSAGVTSVKVGNATPAGATAAQTQAAVTAAFAALTSDALCNAAAVTLTAGNYVPTIMMNKAAGGVSTTTLAYYYSGPQ